MTPRTLAARGAPLLILLLGTPTAGVRAQPVPPTTAELQAHLGAPHDGVAHLRGAQRAAQLLAAERWAEAAALLRELTGAYPLDGTLWGQLAVALRQQRDHAGAVRAYERVLALQGPGLPFRARYWIAAGQAALGDTAAALATLERLVHDDAYLQRPELARDESFATLRQHPAFVRLTGPAAIAGGDRVAGWRADVDHLVAEVERNHAGSEPLPAELYRRQRELKEAVPRLSDVEVAIGLSRMLAPLGWGHTGLWLGFPGSRVDFRPLPLRLWAFPEGIFVTSTGPGHEDLAGAEVVAFAGTPAAEALARVAGARSGESVMEQLWFGPYALSLPATLAGLGLQRESDRATLTFRLPDGSTITRTLSAVDPAEPRWSLDPPPHRAAPRFLRNTAESHWLETLPEHRAVYVQLNRVQPDPDETLPRFGERLREVLRASGARHLILDLRHNNGGNTFTYVELLRTVVAFSVEEGQRVFVLVGRTVYSAAANLAADLERLARPVFVGEPTSATGNQWGDESLFVLPYSGITGAVAGVRWQLSHPWDRRRSIVPQVPVALSAAAYFRGEDPAFDAVLRLIHDGRAPAPAASSERGR